MTYITQGEPGASDALRVRIRHELGWNARVPEHNEAVAINHPRKCSRTRNAAGDRRRALPPRTPTERS